MSTILAQPVLHAEESPSGLDWMKRQLRVPLAEWSIRRRLLVAIAIAVSVFVMGANAWISADLSGVDASRAAGDAASQHVAQAKRSLAQLAALRRDAAASPVSLVSGGWTSADDLRVVSLLAARSGVSLLTLTPGAASGTGLEAMRSLQFTAQTDFLHLLVFLRGLADLPVLVVPEDVTVKRSNGVLVISATLHVFSALSPVAANPEVFTDDDPDADDEDVVFYDPFSPQAETVGETPDAAALRLVGVLRDRARGLALLETVDGATMLEPGQRLGDDRVTALDASSITLTNPAGTRTLNLSEAS
ncbi:hypothetical protein [Paraburkholderia sp. DHOC27]|uniref:hypothetical protein n=1 Tax=Paraburkholderia sp. DHOC27 TaxID=2303330 RepID=UPI000E3C1C90|nr:hypothetical protein [Paraburkholderia sp. DHOC27]RFU43912.1 hypothetical protein D0B32_30415 [Paraburkholderia sp. DHOC27]